MKNYVHSQLTKLMVQQCAIYTMDYTSETGCILRHNYLQGLLKIYKSNKWNNCIYSQLTKSKITLGILYK